MLEFFAAVGILATLPVVIVVASIVIAAIRDAFERNYNRFNK